MTLTGRLASPLWVSHLGEHKYTSSSIVCLNSSHSSSVLGQLGAASGAGAGGVAGQVTEHVTVRYCHMASEALCVPVPAFISRLPSLHPSIRLTLSPDSRADPAIQSLSLLQPQIPPGERAVTLPPRGLLGDLQETTDVKHGADITWPVEGTE